MARLEAQTATKRRLLEAVEARQLGLFDSPEDFALKRARLRLTVALGRCSGPVGLAAAG